MNDTNTNYGKSIWTHKCGAWGNGVRLVADAPCMFCWKEPPTELRTADYWTPQIAKIKLAEAT